jgi:hypothetical protein
MAVEPRSIGSSLISTGRALAEQAGDGWLESVHPDDRAAYLASYRAAVPPGSRSRSSSGYGGPTALIERCGVPSVDVTQLFRGYVGSAIDLTDLRIAQRTRLESRPVSSPGERPSCRAACPAPRPPVVVDGAAMMSRSPPHPIGRWSHGEAHRREARMNTPRRDVVGEALHSATTRSITSPSTRSSHVVRLLMPFTYPSK